MDFDRCEDSTRRQLLEERRMLGRKRCRRGKQRGRFDQESSSPVHELVKGS